MGWECPYFSECAKEIWGTYNSKPLYQRHEAKICLSRLGTLRGSGTVQTEEGQTVYDYNQVGCDLVHSDGEKIERDPATECWRYPHQE
jgi:hypothetical protein